MYGIKTLGEREERRVRERTPELVNQRWGRRGLRGTGSDEQKRFLRFLITTLMLFLNVAEGEKRKRAETRVISPFH